MLFQYDNVNFIYKVLFSIYIKFTFKNIEYYHICSKTTNNKLKDQVYDQTT